MRTVQPGIESIKLFGKDYYIPIVRLRDERDPFHLAEVFRFCQSDPHAIARVSAIGDEILAFQKRNSRILDAKLFIVRKWAVARGSQKGLWIGGELEPVVAARQTDDRPSRAQMGTE